MQPNHSTSQHRTELHVEQARREINMFVQVNSGLVGKLVICNCLLIGFLATLYGTSDAQNDAQLHYITAIENNTTKPPGFMVMTADNNYAIYSPRLVEFNWTSVTVNGDQVFITTTSNGTFTTALFNLEEHERDFISEIKGDFTHSLAGLKLSRFATSDSLFSSYTKQTESAIGAEFSYAEKAIFLADSMNQKAFKDLEAAIEGHQDSGPGSQLLQVGNETQARSFGSSRLEGLYEQRAKSYRMGRKQQDSKQSARFGAYAHMQPKQQAAPKSRNSFNMNYYNLLDSQLASSICGDIYNFDMRNQIFDVYSKSVSMKQEFGSSVLYRDEFYFVYARQDLPLHINRLFVVGENVFFVYDDKSLLLKHDWLLDPLEQRLVIRAQRQLQVDSKWRTKRAKPSFGSSETDGQQQQSESKTDDERAGGDEQARQADQTTAATQQTNDKQ